MHFLHCRTMLFYLYNWVMFDMATLQFTDWEVCFKTSSFAFTLLLVKNLQVTKGTKNVVLALDVTYFPHVWWLTSYSWCRVDFRHKGKTCECQEPAIKAMTLEKQVLGQIIHTSGSISCSSYSSWSSSAALRPLRMASSSMSLGSDMVPEAVTHIYTHTLIHTAAHPWVRGHCQ